jgi:hypothetical protein
VVGIRGLTFNLQEQCQQRAKTNFIWGRENSWQNWGAALLNIELLLPRILFKLIKRFIIVQAMYNS